MTSLNDPLYSFELSEELIGNAPSDKRDESRLFVFDTKTGAIHFDHFKNITKYLPEKSLLVLNETRVVPARVYLHKETGGKVEVLFLMNLWREGEEIIPAIVDRKIEVGQQLVSHDGAYTFHIEKQDENVFVLKPLFGIATFRQFLDTYGETPLPHYIQGVEMTEEKVRARYQTIFGKEAYSIAAPTASLHFTEEVFASLKEKNIEKAGVTLHVGLGTFKPLTDDNFKNNALHLERYVVSEDTAKRLLKAKENKTPIIAVGTTSVRTLESYIRDHTIGEKAEDVTTIFIHPPYRFEMVDHLITNFHLPQSSLMMLVEAFLAHKGSDKHLIDLYKIAIKEKFKFYSFGDSMLIL
ncbi:MAG: hypothetical protein RI935_451 [Candidatus Parcubacteria bacterium]|jgi:S-adenosylmethionine:tRNA ribosyltransferase-isomerase